MLDCLHPAFARDSYQLPPLINGTMAVVVSPLISLMEDQARIRNHSTPHYFTNTKNINSICINVFAANFILREARVCLRLRTFFASLLVLFVTLDPEPL